MLKNTQMEYKIDNITVVLQTEKNGLRLTTDYENWFIPNQTIEETKKITEINYKIVKTHFKNIPGHIISEEDLENVCLKIVLSYFQMYNHWRTMYKKEKNRDLTFLQKDFDHPNTSNNIVDYFQKKYPDIYTNKCETMLNMTSNQFKEFEIRKEQFENK